MYKVSYDQPNCIRDMLVAQVALCHLFEINYTKFEVPVSTDDKDY